MKKLSLLLPSLVAISSGCIQSAPPPQGPAPGTYQAPPPAASADAFPPGYAGFYGNSQWGDMIIQSTPDGRVRATYTHDQGTVEGRWIGNKVVGWWCEVPSRTANADAGEVELTFLPGEGGVRIDGRWRYGTAENEPQWREDWDVTRSAQQQPTDLIERFRDESAFCAHPGS
jgi:hypothetical protein